ncbi:pilus assembly protein N-terminal domain-containing protein [Phenylobacterium sp.]|uniref:type II and III secretion system protein family protein n=1 Tax=Phenylobacterium sp. TaxID=1871053 RepID=UPI0025D7410F|nr:pilus assembly protein N-terminal domain-containing protein [Phenylobacterium sp.]
MAETATGSVLMRLSSILARARAAGLRALADGRGRAAVLAAALAVLSVQPAAADVLPAEAGATTIIHVAVGKSAPLVLASGVTKVVVAQPETARVAAAGPHSLYVMGQTVGATNLLIYGPGAALLQVVNVEVGYDGAQLEIDLRAALPDEPITVETLNTGLLLRGAVSTSEAAATAQDLAERAAPGAVLSLLDVQPSQVMLDVRLVEASEDDLRDIGVDLSATGRHLALASGTGLLGAEVPQSTAQISGHAIGLDLAASLRALERRGATQVLARPELLALSGETASFLAGGEFPYPVPSDDGQLTIQFRPYGTMIAFQPTVQANGLIRLRLTSEVSALDPRNSLQLQNFNVPALSTRRAATTVDLRDGETFLLAGLFQDSHEIAAERTPWAAELPGVGRLFGARRGRGQRLELAVIVTVRLVNGPNLDGAAPDEGAMLTPAVAPPRSKSVSPKLGPRSPLVRAVVTRVAAVAHGALEASRRGWEVVEGWTRQLAGAARPRGPPPTEAA